MMSLRVFIEGDSWLQDQRSLKVLLALPRVARFKMAVMAMPNREKQQMAAAWAAASKTSNNFIAKSLEGLRFLYQV